MAGKRKKTKGRRKKAKTLQVVSLKSALHMVAQAGRRIRARGVRRRRNPDEDGDDIGNIKSNPMRHFPRLPGKGRPAKTRKWDMVTRLEGGAVAEKKFKATTWDAQAKAMRIARKKFNGKRVIEVILDDGK